MNGLAAGVAALTVAVLRGRHTRVCFALWLLFVFDGLVAAGYLVVGGLTKFGDWAVLLDGAFPGVIWRGGAVVVGASFYYAVVRLAAWLLVPIIGSWDRTPARLATIAIGTGLGAAAAAVGAVVYGQTGDWLRFALAGGSSLGVAWSLTLMEAFGVRADRHVQHMIKRSYGVMAVAVLATAAFIVMIGPGWIPTK